MMESGKMSKINEALQYIIDHQSEVGTADDNLLNAVEAIIVNNFWEQGELGRLEDLFEDATMEDIEHFLAQGQDHDTLAQQSEEYSQNIHKFHKSLPEDTQ